MLSCFSLIYIRELQFHIGIKEIKFTCIYICESSVVIMIINPNSWFKTAASQPVILPVVHEDNIDNGGKYQKKGVKNKVIEFCFTKRNSCCFLLVLVLR